MSTNKLSAELQEKLLPQNNGYSLAKPGRGHTGSFLQGSESTSSDHHFLSPALEFNEPNCLDNQTEYLTSWTESLTDDYLHVGFGQSMQPGVSPDILEAITSGQEFPGRFSYLETSPFGGSQQPVPSAGIISATSDRAGVTAYEATKCVPSSGPLVSDLVGVNPFNAGREIDIQQYMIHELEVHFCDLENRVFEKQQSRKDKQARQRIINGKVKFLVRSERPVKNVHAWVRRDVKAATLEKDLNGMVPIEAVFLRKDGDNLEYQVDLDSVYEVHGSDRPVYKLSKVHTQERNQFELLVQVVFTNDELSEHIKSKPFLIRTKRINDEPAEKRKRPNTCPGSSVRWSSHGKHQTIQFTQHALQNEPDSTGSMSPLSACSSGSRNSSLSSEGTSQVDQLVVKHLKAQQANIEKLSFGCMMQTSKGDIAYHLQLTNPGMYQTLEEGVVVGFFPDVEGLATIEPLSSENVSQAVMAGVISRSAYLEAHAPVDKEGAQTDIVCVIGMVKVQILGSVRTGERIYASTDYPGTGIPESHLPLGAFIIRSHTLLGMAMEPCKPRYHDEVNLVKSFVCIVLGINSQQLSSEVENIMENIDMDIKVAIGKSQKRTCRRLFLLIVGLITFLGLLGFLMYELLTPGTLFQYFLCRIGSCPGPHLWCNFTSDQEELDIHFLPFKLKNLKEKIPNGEIQPTELNKSGAIYFLNYDRCAYGGRSDGSTFPLRNTKPVRGPTFLASDEHCSEIFLLSSKETWKVLDWEKTHAPEQLICTCSGVGDFALQWTVLLISFVAYSLVA